MSSVAFEVNAVAASPRVASATSPLPVPTTMQGPTNTFDMMLDATNPPVNADPSPPTSALASSTTTANQNGGPATNSAQSSNQTAAQSNDNNSPSNNPTQTTATDSSSSASSGNSTTGGTPSTKTGGGDQTESTATPSTGKGSGGKKGGSDAATVAVMATNAVPLPDPTQALPIVAIPQPTAFTPAVAGAADKNTAALPATAAAAAIQGIAGIPGAGIASDLIMAAGASANGKPVNNAAPQAGGAGQDTVAGSAETAADATTVAGSTPDMGAAPTLTSVNPMAANAAAPLLNLGAQTKGIQPPKSTAPPAGDQPDATGIAPVQTGGTASNTGPAANIAAMLSPGNATSAHPGGKTSNDGGGSPDLTVNPTSLTALPTGVDPTQAGNVAAPANQMLGPANSPSVNIIQTASSMVAAIPISGLAVAIASRAQAGKNRFEIRLDPPELGRIDVKLDVDRSGNVTSRLVVDKPETLNLLRNSAPQLERALQDAGLKTGDNGLQFSLRDQSAGGHNQNNQDSGSSSPTYTHVVSEEDLPSVTAIRGYGRFLGANGGVDIRV